MKCKTRLGGWHIEIRQPRKIEHVGIHLVHTDYKYLRGTHDPYVQHTEVLRFNSDYNGVNR